MHKANIILNGLDIVQCNLKIKWVEVSLLVLNREIEINMSKFKMFLNQEYEVS